MISDLRRIDSLPKLQVEYMLFKGGEYLTTAVWCNDATHGLCFMNDKGVYLLRDVGNYVETYQGDKSVGGGNEEFVY